MEEFDNIKNKEKYYKKYSKYYEILCKTYHENYHNDDIKLYPNIKYDEDEIRYDDEIIKLDFKNTYTKMITDNINNFNFCLETIDILKYDEISIIPFIFDYNNNNNHPIFEKINNKDDIYSYERKYLVYYIIKYFEIDNWPHPYIFYKYIHDSDLYEFIKNIDHQNLFLIISKIIKSMKLLKIYNRDNNIDEYEDDKKIRKYIHSYIYYYIMDLLKTDKFTEGACGKILEELISYNNYNEEIFKIIYKYNLSSKNIKTRILKLAIKYKYYTYIDDIFEFIIENEEITIDERYITDKNNNIINLNNLISNLIKEDNKIYDIIYNFNVANEKIYIQYINPAIKYNNITYLTKILNYSKKLNNFNDIINIIKINILKNINSCDMIKILTFLHDKYNIHLDNYNIYQYFIHTNNKDIMDYLLNYKKIDYYNLTKYIIEYKTYDNYNYLLDHMKSKKILWNDEYKKFVDNDIFIDKIINKKIDHNNVFGSYVYFKIKYYIKNHYKIKDKKEYLYKICIYYYDNFHNDLHIFNDDINISFEKIIKDTDIISYLINNNYTNKHIYDYIYKYIMNKFSMIDVYYQDDKNIIYKIIKYTLDNIYPKIEIDEKEYVNKNIIQLNEKYNIIPDMILYDIHIELDNDSIKEYLIKNINNLDDNKIKYMIKYYHNDITDKLDILLDYINQNEINKKDHKYFIFKYRNQIIKKNKYKNIVKYINKTNDYIKLIEKITVLPYDIANLIYDYI